CGPRRRSRSCRAPISVGRTSAATIPAPVRSGSRWCTTSRPPIRPCAASRQRWTRAGERAMAASTAPLAEQGGIAGFLARRASEALGVLLIIAALALALALLGHNPNDPSLNHATVGPVTNPLGYVGASIADLG